MCAKAAAAAAAAAGQGNEWIPSCKVWDLVGGHEAIHQYSIFKENITYNHNGYPLSTATT